MKNRFNIVVTILVLLIGFARIAKADEPTYFSPSVGYDGGFYSSSGETFEEFRQRTIEEIGYDPLTGQYVEQSDNNQNENKKSGKLLLKTYIYITTSTNKEYRLASLKKNTSITVKGFSGKYAVIEYNGDKAYVLADNVSAKLQAGIKANISSKTYVYTKMNTGKKYREQGLAKGTEITLTARYGKWWEFTINSQTLYIQSKYVSLPE